MEEDKIDARHATRKLTFQIGLVSAHVPSLLLVYVHQMRYHVVLCLLCYPKVQLGARVDK